MNWLWRMALRLLPRAWRDAVAADVEEEARRSGRSRGWAMLQILRISMPLRWLFGGDTLLTDVRYAFRSLIRARWFTAGAVCTFAVGVAAAIAVLTAVDRVLLRPLPYDAPDRIYLMYEPFDPAAKTSSLTRPGVVFDALRARPTSVEQFATVEEPALYYESADVGEGPPIRLSPATAAIFDVLGVSVVRGRRFDAADLRGAATAVLSYEAWQRRFGRSDDVIGRRLWARSGIVEIVGVLPRGFVTPGWMPDSSADGLVLTAERGAGLRTPPAILRLRAGVSAGVAEQELSALFAGLAAEQPNQFNGPPRRVRLREIRPVIFGYYTRYLWLVSAAAGIVLLLCSVNLAMLLLARGRAREPMAALQVALGASRRRLLGLALLESTLICAVGSAMALAVVALAADVIRASVPAIFARYDADWFDLRIVAFTIGLTLAASLVAGIWPAVRASRADATSLLQAGTGFHRPGRRFAALLIVAEAALGVVLVSGAATVVHSFVRVATVDVGFNPTDLYSVSIRPARRYDLAADAQLMTEALALLRLSPGVRHASAAHSFSSGSPIGQFCCMHQIASGYIETFGVTLLAGRDFTREEVTATAPVALISGAAAAAFWPGAEPPQIVGRTLEMAGEPPRQIVGVLGDIRNVHLGRGNPRIYVPIPAALPAWSLAARSDPERGIDVRALRSRAREIFGPATTVAVTPYSSELMPIVDYRFRAVLFGVFGVIALVVAVAGLYAVSAFDTAMRQREMSIRMTLGATAGDVRRAIVARLLAPVLAGLAIGLIGSWWAARFLQSFVFEINARDPRTLALVGVAFVAVAVVAGWLPARRAARADPAAVLKAV